MVPRDEGLVSHDPQSVTVLRGRVLSFVSEPQGVDDAASYRYIEDGAVVIGGDGKIIMIGPFNPKAAAHHTVIDHRPHLILPGFIVPMHAGVYGLVAVYTYFIGLIDHSGVRVRWKLPASASPPLDCIKYSRTPSNSDATWST